MFAGGVNIGPHVRPLYVKLFEKRRCPQLLQISQILAERVGLFHFLPVAALIAVRDGAEWIDPFEVARAGNGNRCGALQ